MKKIKKLLFVLSLVSMVGCNGSTSSISSSDSQSSEVSSSETSSSSVESSSSSSEEIIVSQTLYCSSSVRPYTNRAGTEEDPMNIIDAISILPKGGTILLMDGTYNLYETLQFNSWTEKNVATKESERKTFKAINSQKAIFDCSGMSFNSTNRGLSISSSYWTISGLEVFGAGDNGIYIGGSHNIIEDCVTHDCSDTGIQLGRANSSQDSIDTWPSYNLIKNCTSFDNHDPLGEDSDGFACKLTTGVGNVFDGCIAYNNVDDGWDLYTKGDTGPIGPVILRNCIAFNNGITTGQNTNGKPYGTPNSDGNGFKLGGEVISVQHEVYNCVAFNNLACGFTDNSNPGTIRLENCTSYNNGARDYDANNFDLCRNVDTSNNYMKNLFSYCDNNYAFNLTSNKTFNSKDQYKGTAVDSIFYYGRTMLQFNGIEECDYTLEELRGSIIESEESPFVSTQVPDRMGDIHKLLRDENGNVNLGDFLKIKDSFVNSAFDHEVSLGARLF